MKRIVGRSCIDYGRRRFHIAEMGVHRLAQTKRVNFAIEVKMGDLSQSMNAGVGAAGAVNFNFS